MKLLMFCWCLLLCLFTSHIHADLAISKEQLEKQLSEHIKYSDTNLNRIGRILIEDRSGGINQGTWLYVKSALEYYKKNRPIFIILELNTPGGEVFSAQKISDALKDFDIQTDIPVIAFINNWAISAGAMLAYSSRFIATVKDGSMGAAEPLVTKQTGETEVASEKVNSAIRADFANRAGFFDRNPYIAMAMVDKDIILVQRDGQIIKVDNESQINSKEPNPDIVISPKGKLLTLNANELIKYGVADFVVMPKKLDPITESELEMGIWPANKSLLMQEPFLASIPNTQIDSYRMDWKMRFFVWLAHPVVSSVLFLGLMLGIYMELSSPGFGLAGTIAFICLFLIILSSFSLEIASWLEIILLLAGLMILLIELFVLPTFGLLGIFGAIIFLMGLFGLMLPGLGSFSFEYDTGTVNAAGEAFMSRLAMLSGTFIIGCVIIFIIARYITPSFKGFRRLVLVGNEQEGYIAGEAQKDLPAPGTKGEVYATLRPAGKIIIQDTIYDAISSGGFIEKGIRIKVVKLDGSVIVVATVEEEDRL